CETFGDDQLSLSKNNADPKDLNVDKTALGAAAKLAHTQLYTAAESLTAARADRYKMIAVELAYGGVVWHAAPLGSDVCLAVGAAEHGCSPALLAGVDAVTYIPQIGRVGSLNVAVATAIALAEARRREWVAFGEEADAPIGG